MSPSSSHVVNSASLTEFGAFLLAALFNAGLFGVLSVQAYIYYLAFPQDPRFARLLVNGIYLVEAFETIVVIYDTYTMLGTRFGDHTAFSERLLVWIQPITVSIVMFAVHSYYAYCIRLISQSRKVSVAIVLLTVIQLIGGILTSAFIFTNPPGPSAARQRAIKVLWHTGSALCDIIISISMTYYLRTSMKRTQLLLRRIVRLTVETGSLTAIVTIVCVIMIFMKNHNIYNSIYMGIIGKLYANSVVVLINSRLKLGGERDDEAVDVYCSTIQLSLTGPESENTAQDNGVDIPSRNHLRRQVYLLLCSLLRPKANTSLP